MKAKHLKCHYCTFKVELLVRSKGGAPKRLDAAYATMNTHMEMRHKAEFYEVQNILNMGREHENLRTNL